MAHREEQPLLPIAGGQANDPPFDQVLRGYDRKQVDRFISQLETELSGFAARREEAEKQARDFARQVQQLQSDLAEVRHRATTERPTYKDLGARFDQIFSLVDEELAEARKHAERQGGEIRAAAERAAIEHRKQLEAESAEKLKLAEAELQEAQQQATNLRKEAESALAEAQQQAHRMRAAAQTEAAHTVDEAKRLATLVQGEAESKAGKMLTVADRHAALTRSEADEYAAASTKKADKYAETTRKQTDDSARSTVEAARKESSETLTSARKESEETLTSARREAEETVTRARQEADATLTKARSESTQMMDTATERVSVLDGRRRQIKQEITRLREAVAHLTGGAAAALLADDDDDEAPAGPVPNAQAAPPAGPGRHAGGRHANEPLVPAQSDGSAPSDGSSPPDGVDGSGVAAGLGAVPGPGVVADQGGHPNDGVPAGAVPADPNQDGDDGGPATNGFVPRVRPAGGPNGNGSHDDGGAFANLAADDQPSDAETTQATDISKVPAQQPTPNGAVHPRP